ncbi:MAG: hypothetical protein ACOYOA_02815 [Saprospiraceae bacterium]
MIHGARRSGANGVKIAYGTDAGIYPHRWKGKQLYYVVKFGLTSIKLYNKQQLMQPTYLTGKTEQVP